jgi:murein DD-endopeptidase MepM/ murein hydrolase activator NlpD
LSDHYKPYRGPKKRRGRRGEKKTSTFGIRAAASAVLLALVLGARLAFPQYTEPLQRWFLGNGDYVSAFTAIGEGLNGEKPLGQSVKDAFVYAFSNSASGSEDDVVAVSEPAPADEEAVPAAQEEQSPAAAAFAARQTEFGDPDLPEDVTDAFIALPVEEIANPMAGTLRSGFGYRLDPVSGVKAFHRGVDVEAPAGTPVGAFCKGTVTVIGESTLYGQYVIVEGEDIQTQYAHLSQVSVTCGQQVTAGETIGLCGDTGTAQTAMLHFDLLCGGSYVNPEHYFSWD